MTEASMVPPTRLVNRYWITALFLAIPASMAIQYFLFGKISGKELICSWLLTYPNALLALVSNGKALSKREGHLLVWGLWMGLIRITVLAVLIVAIERAGFLDFLPFLDATFTSYIILLVGEVLGLHFASLER
jgi:hypothetical protein